MADNTENIGSVSVSIVGDYSQLSQDFDAAVALAVKEGATLAEALNKAYDSINVTPLVEAFTGVGSAATGAAEQLKLFDAAAHVDYADAAGQLNLFATEMERLGPAASNAASGVMKLPDEIKQVGDNAAVADQKLTDMLGPLLRLSGLSLSVGGLVALGGDALSAFGDLQKADIALTAITGDADAAKQSIEGLKQLALDDALSFPALLTANQRLTEFGVSAEAIPGALNAIADAAAATNRSFDTVATSFERIVESGVVMNRTLVTLGITTQDMADVMGVSIDQVKKVFAGLDQTLRAEIITQALQKLAGTSKEVAAGLLGQWQDFKTNILFTFQQIGEGLEPLATKILKVINDAFKTPLPPDVEANLLAFEGLSGPPESTEGTGSQDLSGAPGATGLTPDQIKAQVALQVAADAAKAAYKQMEDAAISFNNATVNLWNSLPATYDAYIAKLDSGGKSAKSILDAITADLDKAATTMMGMSGQPLKDMQAWVDGLTQAQTRLQGFADSDAAYKLALSIQTITDKQPQLITELGASDDALQQFFDRMAYLADHAPDPFAKLSDKALIDAAIQAQKQLDDSGKKLTDTFTKFFDVYEERTRRAIGITDDFKVKFGELATITSDTQVGGLAQRGLSQDLLDAYQHALDLNKAYKDLGVTVDSEGQIMSKAIKDLNLVLGDENATLGVVELAWGKWSAAVNKLAKTDLPAAEAEYDKTIAKLQALGAPEGQLLALEEARLKLTIQQNDLSGVDSTAEIEALTEKTYRTQALKDASENLGNVYKGLRKDFDDVFASLSKGLADAIVNGKNLGDVFINVGKQIATSILDTIIKGALVPLQDELNKTGGLFDSLAKSITGTLGKSAAGSVGDIAGGSSAGLPGGPLATLGGGGSGAAEGGGAASSAGGVGSALSGIANVANIVGAAATVISGIVQGFQMAHLENLLGEVEVTTRKIEAETGGNGAESIFGYAKASWLDLQQIVDELSQLHSDNADVLTQLETLVAAVEAGGGGGSGSGGGGGGLSTSDLLALNSVTSALSSLAVTINSQQYASGGVNPATFAPFSAGGTATQAYTLNSAVSNNPNGFSPIANPLNLAANALSAVAPQGAFNPSQTFSATQESGAALGVSAGGLAYAGQRTFQDMMAYHGDPAVAQEVASRIGELAAEHTLAVGRSHGLTDTEAMFLGPGGLGYNAMDAYYAQHPLVQNAGNTASPTPSNLIPSTPVSSFNTGGFGGGSIPITVNALNPASRGVVDGIITGLRQVGVKV